MVVAAILHCLENRHQEDVCAPLLNTDTGLLEIFSYIELVEFTAVESVDKRPAYRYMQS